MRLKLDFTVCVGSRAFRFVVDSSAQRKVQWAIFDFYDPEDRHVWDKRAAENRITFAPDIPLERSMDALHQQLDRIEAATREVGPSVRRSTRENLKRGIDRQMRRQDIEGRL